MTRNKFIKRKKTIKVYTYTDKEHLTDSRGQRNTKRSIVSSITYVRTLKTDFS